MAGSEECTAVDALTNIFFFLGIFVFFIALLGWLIKEAKKKDEIQTIAFNDDEFLKEHGYSWDFVFVYKVLEEDERLTQIQRDATLKKTLRKLNHAGLQTKMFYSVQRDEVYVKVRGTTDRLRTEAARIDYKMAVDSKAAEKRARLGRCDENRKLIWQPFEINGAKKFSSIRVFEYVFGKYVIDDDMQEMYKIYRTTNKIFRSVDRIKLLWSIMEAETFEGGAGLNINTMVKKKAVLAAFPLHTWGEKTEIMDNCLQMFMAPWTTPVDLIKDYFGEKLGLYFLFLTHYATWLISAGLIGVGIYVEIVFACNNPNVWGTPFFCFFMSLWTTLFLEYWKRKEITASMRWGTQGFEESEEDRPEYEGEIMNSPIDGEKKKIGDGDAEDRAKLISSICISIAILIVIILVANLFFWKFQFKKEPIKSILTVGGIELGAIIISLANAVQIQILSAIYNKVALHLNDSENHRTDTEYEDALISKTFSFQFINSYSSLIYIAFIKQYVEDGGNNEAIMGELSTALSTIFLTRLISANINGTIVASKNNDKKMKEETDGIEPGVVLTPAEREFSMAPYDVLLTTFANYAELAIQFGYATLFAAAFPLAPIMACLSNYIKIRVDVWKLCQILRRPEPRTAEDIGTWYSIYELISSAAILSNTALVCFTGTFFTGTNALFMELNLSQRLILFLVLEHSILAIKYIVAEAMPDVPDEVEIQLGRSEFIASKVIENIPDEQEELDVSKEDMDFVIEETDNDYYFPNEETIEVPDDPYANTV